MDVIQNRICAWCKKPLGIKDVNGITHGVCEECERKMNEMLDAEEASKEPSLPKPPVVSFNLSRTAIKQSNHQLITNAVVNILLDVSGRGGDIDQAQTSIKELKDRGVKDIGKLIMARMDESIHDKNTLWGKMPLIELTNLRARFRTTMIQIMNYILASEGQD